MYQTLKSKYIKHTLLSKSVELIPHLPYLELYSRERVYQFVGKYPTVFIKPDNGARGSGIIRLSKKNGHLIAMNSNGITKDITFKQLPEWSQKLHVIQQGIRLQKYYGNNFDIRFHLQKEKDDWGVAGVSAKVGVGDMFALTFQYGGRLLYIHDVLRSFASEEDVKTMNLKLYYLAHKVSEVLSMELPGIRELGIDFGIDDALNPWIFEVNTQPIGWGFKTLDMDMYHRISHAKEKLKELQTKQIDFEEL